jgi:hypothetical protein
MSELNRKLDELVAASRKANLPTEADADRILAALRHRLGDAAVAGEETVRAAATSHTPQLLFGKVAASALAGLVLIGGLLFVTARNHRAASSESKPVPSVAATIPVEPALAPSASAASAATTAHDGVAAPNPAEARSRRTRDRLAEEVALLVRAETALRSGKPAVALAVLSEHERKFRDGLLAEERIAARIQALCALGRQAEADTQLARLSPKSLHGEQLRGACGSAKSN